jgi:hypothetical protein
MAERSGTEQLVRMADAESDPRARETRDSIGEIERYLRIPNHALFLYTAEDYVLWSYIDQFRNDLDALSGDWCDIHTSRAHQEGRESAYQMLRSESPIPGLNEIRYSSLPCLHVWSDHKWITIALEGAPTRERITQTLRTVFDELRCCPDGLDANGCRRIRDALEKLNVSKSDRRTSDSMAMLMLAFILFSIVITVSVGFKALGIWTGFGAVVGAVVLYGVFGALTLRYVGRMSERGMLELIGMSFSFGLRGIRHLSGARSASNVTSDEGNKRMNNGK